LILSSYSDDEQLEAIKKWWQENGNSLLMGVALVVVGVFSFRQWESSQQSTAAAASQLYQEMLELMDVEAGQVLNTEDMATVSYMSDRLKDEYSNSIYARYAALFMSRLHVEREELEQAARSLSWILDNPSQGFLKKTSPELMLTARLRLARVVMAQGDPQRALNLLTAVDPGLFASSYAEAEGDAYLALGQTSNAREAYRRALAGAANAPLLELKLRDLEGDLAEV
jgi:predicted negative regulator of RcsB-dependent stress response